MSPTRTPARRIVAVLLLSLFAVLAPVAGPAVADTPPVPTTLHSEFAPSASAPQSALPGRAAPGGPGSAPDDATAHGHPGPALDALVLALPEVGGDTPDTDRDPTGGPEPGHRTPADPRGPPAA
ncbi:MULTISPECIES: hypothetical protein [Pseudonocardia]|uniref:Uncharacterized protein n=2 Tax=Pseudonocardia TaxID=1847 RepID=A0A1Y2MJK3_PSEAH|nr:MULTISPECIES: hypothetical protein [Pseudonocardia]OSY35444.1 hypothetical protein BG845_06080 [Pseudonocardia autotrophica]TDN72195.1 hypothetical protein C8E95_1248 [Pseudonocardia autotrophica]BBG02902.1 hypothetical protein Pdca_41110 [Pseudonocardia autotrophica]GEC27634.1 hypothetical protein PSA01_46630 [Pseudonocardia saturnea]